MIILGVVLLIVGFLTGIPIIWTLGIIALVIGVILAVVGASGRAVGGRATTGKTSSGGQFNFEREG